MAGEIVNKSVILRPIIFKYQTEDLNKKTNCSGEAVEPVKGFDSLFFKISFGSLLTLGTPQQIL